MRTTAGQKGRLALLTVVRRASALPRGLKTAVIITFDFFVLTIVAFLSYAIRFSGSRAPTQYQTTLLLCAPLITCICLYILRNYGNIIRLHTRRAESSYVFSISLASLIWSFIIFLVGVDGFPRSLVVLYGGLSIIVYIALRRLIAWLFHAAHINVEGRENVAILGVNHFGLSLVDSLRASGSSRPVLFIDSDAENVGRRVAGLPVVSIADLRDQVAELNISAVILALTLKSRRHNRALLEELASLPVRVQTIAMPEDVLSGRVSISDVRPINIEEFLGREPIQPNRELMANAVSKARLMVTGAGGSIGSELVRQALSFEPTILVLFELSEVALYEIERETRARVAASGAFTKIVPVLGSVGDERLVADVMNAYAPEVVLHAAAYKHVPLGESNAGSCVANNVFGTRVLADAAIAAGVRLFVLISTDKAVRPTNIMGASKRMAELVLQDRAAREAGTVFTSVRFGNVLGSSGSVIPLFRDQISRGGPVTVTDRRMTRFFMTIPEAVELVLQAAGMAHGGDVFVLDMGEPVKIDTLARALISQSNLTVRDAANPGGEIEIVYSGIRPGEKLYEELLISDNVVSTAHPRIMRCLERSLGSDELAAVLRQIEDAIVENSEPALRRLLSRTVEGFKFEEPTVQTKQSA